MIALLALPAVLSTTGCFSNHTIGEDGGPNDAAVVPGVDGGGITPGRDGGGITPGEDSGGPPRGDAAVAPFRDAGVRPLGDAGPPGDHAGDVWAGYIESYMFPSGSDDLRIVFDSASGAGPRTGVVIFGDAPAPAPATDPNIGNPVGGTLGSGTRAIEGFEYRFEDGVVEPSRVRLSIDLGDLYETWCALQYPVPRDATGESYGCLPNTGLGMGESGCSYPDPSSGEPTAIDCGRLELCGIYPVCACTASECVAASAGAITFDFHVTGADGSGTIALGGLHNIYLTR